MRAEIQVTFPEAVLDPGRTVWVSVDLDGKPVRLQKLIMIAEWDAIRGLYRIKRSKLPLLDAADTLAYTRLRRWSNGEKFGYRADKTVVAYAGQGRHFVREYLPASVVYVPVDPARHVMLTQLLCGQTSALNAMCSGIPVSCFAPAVLDNGIYAPTTNQSLSLCLKNFADVQIRVRVLGFGVGLAQERSFTNSSTGACGERPAT